MDKYTEEQVKDIRERQEKAIKLLETLELTPAAQIMWENTGTDSFVTRMIPYLADTKYNKAPIKSPFPIK